MGFHQLGYNTGNGRARPVFAGCSLLAVWSVFSGVSGSTRFAVLARRSRFAAKLGAMGFHQLGYNNGHGRARPVFAGCSILAGCSVFAGESGSAISTILARVYGSAVAAR